MASSSLAAMMVAGGAPSAFAACSINDVGVSVGPITNSAAINCINVQNSAVTGNVINTGTGVITANGGGTPSKTGITINASTIGGSVSNAGTITANSGGGIIVSNNALVSGGIANSGVLSASSRGILVAAVSTFSGGIANSGMISANGLAGASGIAIEGLSTFTGGIANSGTLSAGSRGILVAAVSTFSGGIANSGKLNAGLFGIEVGITSASSGVSNFSGGVTNSGTISAADGGIFINGVSTFTGGIANSGTIAAGGTGIEIHPVSTFAGGITNSGMISAGATGIDVIATTFAGGITNSGTISAGVRGIFVGVSSGATAISTFAGGITNSGTISAGNFGIDVAAVSAFAGGITNSGTISAGSFGIGVAAVSDFAGGITNSGTISAVNGQGILVGATSGASAISTFTGGITNSGTIRANVGILVVGVSTFSGGIANSGTISANGGITVAEVSTFSGGIANSGTISSLAIGLGQTSIRVIFVSTFTGGITNSGMLSAASRGIVIDSVSTFAGGIANNGTISVNGVAGQVGISISSVSTFAGGITNSGTIATSGIGIEGVDVTTLAGGITNSGRIIAQTAIFFGTGVATFSGAIVNSGTMIGTGGTAIDIANGPNGMTIDILGGAISGNIIGAGTASGDTVNFALGSGSFAYANAITGMQFVNINSGTLFDNGSITAADVTVNSGGTLAPGLPGTIGTLSIAGKLTFDPGNYEIQLTPTQHAFTTVSGTATIGGGAVVLSPSGPLGAHYAASTFAILTSGGTLTGTFNPTVTYAGAVQLSSTPTLSYDPNDVYLSYANALADLTTPAGANQNQRSVIAGINNAILGGDTVPAGFQQLVPLSGAAYLNALTELDGEDATGAATSTFTLMDEFLGLMIGEGGGVGGGPGGNGGLGFAPDQRADALPPELALAYDSILKAPPKQTFDQRWSTWASGFGGGSFLQGNAAVGSNNVNADTYGSAAGMEYRPDPNARLGFALAGSGLNWGLADNLGTGRSDAFQAGVYGKRYFGPAYVSAALAFGNNWFTTNRTALGGDQLTASFTGQSYAIRGEAGYRFALPMQYAVIGVTPYAALQTQWFHTPAYSETDLTGGGLGLSYNATTANDTRSELGARFDDLTAWNAKPLLLRASLAWAHDWESGTALNAAFESLPGSSFTVNGAPLPPDSALTSASAQYFFTPNWSFTAKFDGEFAPTAQTYAGSGTLKYTW